MHEYSAAFPHNSRNRLFTLWNTAGLALLLVALLLRAASLDRLPLWVDEAESSINALTILQHGVPADSYLGIPIYENTHIVSWPESREYRFKDVSYNHGLAVYHGWIPLYAIAASLWVTGILPDELTGPPYVKHTSEEKRLRTVAPRIPAVAFGLLGVIVFYLAGKAFSGKHAGLAAAIIAALSPMHIYVSQQARYFSATVTFSALCAYATWRLVHRQRWRDGIVCGIAFGILFHTHFLTFVVATIMLGLAVLALLFRPGQFRWSRLAAVGCITAAMVLPWIAATDFLHIAAKIPSAWQLMSLPDDLVLYRVLANRAGLVVAVGFVALGIGIVRYKPFGVTKLAGQFTRYTRSLVFLVVWLFVAYAAFTFLIPAASYALARMGVMMLAPATLLLGCLCAGIARSMSSRYAAGGASVLACAVVAASYYLWPMPADIAVAMQQNDIDAAVSYIASLPIRADTRLYANPNDHLLLTYYCGVPIQSIAPVREDFLNHYPGDVVLLTKQDFFVHPGDPIDPPHLRQAAQHRGVSLPVENSIKLSHDLATYSHRTLEKERCAAVAPPLQPPPNFAAQEYAQWYQLREQRQREYASKWVRFPMFRGFPIRTITEWWTVFFFRFANPEVELQKPNYEARMRNATAATVPGSNWAVYYSPGQSGAVH